MTTYNQSKANLGKHLERIINITNNQYRNSGVADIRNVPTPVQITGIGKRMGEVRGRLRKGEWVDYVGACYGKLIAFDAKEISSTTSFPLRNISDHQYELLKSWHEKGAISFLIIQFTKMHEEIYVLPFRHLEYWWEQSLNGGRKSISHKFFSESCKRVKSRNGYALDYIDVLDFNSQKGEWM